MNTKTAIAWIVVLLLVAGGIWYYVANKPAWDANQDVAQPEEEVQQEEEASEASVVGSWRSTQDPNFTREFRANGTVVDGYAGDESATVTGSWEMVASASLAQIGLPAVEGTVIRIQFPEEAMYFLVNSETDADTLSLTYVSGNGVLEFERI